MKDSILISNLTVNINKHLILDHISFNIRPGKITVLLGPNGSGKTTLLKTLNGLLAFEDGSIIQGGERVKKLDKSIMLFDEPILYEELTGKEHIMFILDLLVKGKCLKQKEILQWIGELDLKQYMEDPIFTYSLGTKKKLQFLCSIISNPEIILMDEYISGLDPKMLYIIKRNMKDFVVEGKYVLLSTHMLDMAERFCDDVIIINNGKIINEIVNISEILEKYKTLEEYYINMGKL